MAWYVQYIFGKVESGENSCSKFCNVVLAICHLIKCVDALSRKRAKMSKSSSAEVASDDVCSASTDSIVKPECNVSEKDNENYELPASQCRAMLLSQSGKFIPKFVTKKKTGDCLVKLECTPNVLTRSDEHSLQVAKSESTLFGGVVADVHGPMNDSSADANGCVAMTDTGDCGEISMPFVHHAKADKDGAASAEEHSCNSLPDCDLAERSDANRTQKLPEEETEMRDHSVIVTEAKTSAEEADVGLSDEIPRCLAAVNTDLVENRRTSFDENITDAKADECYSAGEPVPVRQADAQFSVSETAVVEEDSQYPEGTDEVVSRGANKPDSDNAASGGIAPAKVDTENSSSHRIVSEIVAEICNAVSPAEQGYVEPQPDAMSSVDGGQKTTMPGDNGSAISVGEPDVCPENAAGDDDAEPVIARDTEAKIGDAMEANLVSEPSTESVTEPNEPALFDDFLDLTDSQLCQLDDMSR